MSVDASKPLVELLDAVRRRDGTRPADLGSLFDRPDLDLHVVAHQVLRMLRASSALSDLFLGDDACSAPDLRDRLRGASAVQRLDLPVFHQALRHAVVSDRSVERVLTAVRAICLERAYQGASDDPGLVRMMATLGCQSFNNEYVFDVSPEELAKTSAILARVQTASSRGAPDAGDVAALSMYGTIRDLPEPGVRACRTHPELALLVARQVDDYREEEALAGQIESFGSANVGDDRVRHQYEESPYPRWFHLTVAQRGRFADAVSSRFPEIGWSGRKTSIRALVAGCGTGKEPLMLATRYPDLSILAIDFSRRSLAFAVRECRKYGSVDLRFLRGDVLEVAALGASFDFIESIGVLHHLEDPEAGLRALTGVLAPDGCMRIGVYSLRAREPLRPFQAFAATSASDRSPAGLRALRATVLQRPGSELLCRFRDMYYLSGFRDLVCHEREASFTPLEFGKMAERCGLHVLGSDADEDVRGRYAAYAPDDPRMQQLDRVDRFEAEHGALCRSIQTFWLSKR